MSSVPNTLFIYETTSPGTPLGLSSNRNRGSVSTRLHFWLLFSFDICVYLGLTWSHSGLSRSVTVHLSVASSDVKRRRSD